MAHKDNDVNKKIRSTIGENIRRRRNYIGMSRKAFAKEISLSQASVSNIENGKQSLTAEKLWHLSLVLQCPVAELLPPIPEEYNNYDEQINKIGDERSRQFARELAAISKFHSITPHE